MTNNEKCPYKNMEIGNMVFGHSRGNVPVKRGKWQEDFAYFLEQCGFDNYGDIDESNGKMYPKLTPYLKKVEDGEEYEWYFDNGTFRIMCYSWGESEKICSMPNFIYYPTGYSMQWYKYPLRDSYANKEISYSDFLRMLADCRRSIK